LVVSNIFPECPKCYPAASAAARAFSGSLGLPGRLIHIGEIVVTFVIFAFLFGMVYKVLPDMSIDWADVWMGRLVTAARFVAGKFFIGLYLGHSSTASAYGIAGSLALLLLWTYYSSMSFLPGAEFTQVWTVTTENRWNRIRMRCQS
jgi:membrane protein